MVEQIRNLKTGTKYKATPIGKIPVDWEVKKLIETASEERYSFTGGPFGSNLKQDSYTDYGVRVIQLQNIGDGKFFDDYKIFTSGEKANELKNCNIYPGDIIIAKMADPVARACIIPDLDKTYLMASDGIRLSVNKNKHDVKFILYAINSPYFRGSAEKHSTGTTRFRIGLTELKNLQIAIPPLSEQKRIADILTTLDDTIEKAAQIIEKTKEAKKGLMKRLLAHGIGHKKLKKTEIGEIPERWEVGRLGDLCVAQPEYGANVPAIDKDNDLPRYLRITDITEDGKLSESTWQSIKRESAEPYLLKEGDFLFARSGATVGKTYLYRKRDGESAFAGDMIRFKPKLNQLLPELLFQYAHSNFYYDWVKGILRAGVQPNINAQEFSNMPIPKPPLEEQKQIVDILSSIDNETEKESNKKEQLESLKKGLMQVLLTGKIRVTM